MTMAWLMDNLLWVVTVTVVLVVAAKLALFRWLHRKMHHHEPEA
jgi:heme/copper-type cytochrome/quinol oxidase subunit 2